MSAPASSHRTGAVTPPTAGGSQARLAIFWLVAALSCGSDRYMMDHREETEAACSSLYRNCVEEADPLVTAIIRINCEKGEKACRYLDMWPPEKHGK